MRIRFLLFVLSLSLFLFGQAHAQLTIQISQGVAGALPIGVVPFSYAGPGQAPQDIAAIIAANLQRSGRFAPLARNELIARPDDATGVVYADWRKLGIDNLVVGKVRPLPDGRFQVQFQLLDTLRGSQLAGYSIVAQRDRLRQTAHQISDIIYEALTGERGAFDTHIAYVTDTQGPDGRKTYKLALADADGHNEQIVLESAQPVLSPAWAPDGRRLAYVSFTHGRPEVVIQNVFTGEVQRVASHPGLNSAPAWSPDGRRLALTLSKDGNPEIYVLDVQTRTLQRITNNAAIDTEPTWTPDGRAIVFTSDRGGRPQLYQVEVGRGGAAGAPRRLTYEGNYNARAAVSPDGKHVAMVHSNGNGYQIAVLGLQDNHLRVLTESRLAESPSFAPNGSMIIYATEDRRRGVLEAVSVDGRAQQRLSLQRGDVREPAWSPFKAK